MKAANALDKLVEKLESLNYKCLCPNNQSEYDCLKADALSLLEAMSELVNADEEDFDETDEDEK